MLIFMKEYPTKNYQDILHSPNNEEEYDETTQYSNHKEILTF